MSLSLSIAAYFTIWWVALFAVLPFGVRSATEAGSSDAPPGADPGAPVFHNLGKKALWTTLLAAVIFVVVDAYVYYVS